MTATFATTRWCPYCGSDILLAKCPTVATNFPQKDFREQTDLEEIELPSGTRPIRVLEKTRWPVVAEAPVDREVVAEPVRKRSSIEEAFARSFRSAREPQLPPLVGDGVFYEDVPSRACYVCEFPLPPDIDDRPAWVIAIVGVNRVGKTHLLAASLTEAYARRGLAPLDCREFVPSEVSSTRFMVDYNHPLFRRNELLNATQAERETRFEPLVFNVTLGEKPPFSLVVHDVSGEVLGDYQRRAEAATFLRAARGIIFVLDPRDIDAIRDSLPEWILEDEGGFDQGALLAATLREGASAHQQYVPVAVTVAKADLLPMAAREEDLAFLAPADPAAESFDEFSERIVRQSEQVIAFLEKSGAHHLIAPAKMYKERAREQRDGLPSADRPSVGTVTYHAVSALGSAPDANRELPRKVRPINCIDPLAAVLAQVAQLW